MQKITNCLISTGFENETRKVDISIDGEKIAKIEPAAGKKGDIDASGLLAIPGAIDPHVHFDTPGFTDREDFAHGSRSAATGGVTTVIDMPCTSLPPVTNVANLKNKLSVIEKTAFVDFALWGGVSQNAMREDDWFSNMEELWENGVAGFKTYQISGMDSFRALTFMELGQAMQKAALIGALIGLHAEDGKFIRERTGAFKKAGKNSLEDYFASRADPAEKNGVAEGIGLAKQTKVKLHIVHVGSASAGHVIEIAKTMGLDVSAETCPHYLAFTHEDFAKYGSLIKTAPVIKEKSDREGLWEYLKKGTIDFIATDHAPCPISEKKTGSAWTDYGGIPGVEFLLAFAFSEGFKKDRLTLAKLIEVTSTASAKRFGLYPRKGAIEVGADADIVLIDPDKKWKVSGEKMCSKAKWTPFEGWEFTGKIVSTILRGKVVYTENTGVAKKPCGVWIKRLSRIIC